MAVVEVVERLSGGAAGLHGHPEAAVPVLSPGRLQGRFPYGLIRVHAGHGGGLGGCAGWRLLAGAGM